MGRFFYGRNDREVKPFAKADLVERLIANRPSALTGSLVAQVSNRDGVKFTLTNNSWLLIRPSGTEPVLRIYAEAHSHEAVTTLLAEGTVLAQRVLNGI